MRHLNLGCGSNFHPDWTNVDFTATGKDVIAWNLRRGIPFPDQSFDAVYHSHVLEHFSRKEAVSFLRECYRVLTLGGILRVVVPDLEQIARLYLYALENASDGSAEWARNYEWILLEMYDQTVRSYPGGSMADYLRQEPLENEKFIIDRVGFEAENLIQTLRSTKSEQTAEKSPDNDDCLGDRERLLKEILGHTDYTALKIGRFRQSGEVHQWMYDRYSLRHLLEQTGFEDICICRHDESNIPNFNTFQLDVQSNGKARKPDSLFMEAKKLAVSTIIPMPATHTHDVVSGTPSDDSVHPPKDLEDLALFKDLNAKIAELQQDLKKARKRANRLKSKLNHAEALVSEMQSSRFWKMRSYWLAICNYLMRKTPDRR